jgi:tetratricopeptide (TPR) repeat protein
MTRPVDVPRGTIVAGWRVLEHVASGSWGSVYEAEYAAGGGEPPDGLPRQVAVKLLPAGRLTPAQHAALAEVVSREQAASHRLRHPHVIRTYAVHTLDDGADELAGDVVLVMERARRSLRDLLERGSLGTSVPGAARLLAELWDGMSYLHRHGWVHGDLKPGNILLTEDNSVRIADFGVAAELEGSHAYAPAVASTDYAPPEWWAQTLSPRGVPTRPATDVWAFGIIAHQLISGGLHPFPGSVPRARAAAIRAYADPAELRLSRALSEDWAGIVADCLTIHPAERIVRTRGLAERLTTGAAGARSIGRTGAARSTADASARPEAAPCQLPGDIADFTGRKAETNQLLRQLGLVDGDWRRPTATAVPLAVIVGQAGAGKTTLAVHAAHRLRTHYPDGQLFVDLRGIIEERSDDETADASDVLARFLRALGLSAGAIPSGLGERAEVYRAVLADRRLLVVLDNADDERQIRPLLPGGAGCGVIVTSRRRLSALEGAEPITLGMMSTADGLDLLARLAGAGRVEADRAAACDIVELCGRLPLAIRTAGARLSGSWHWTLRRLADRLDDERGRLDELAAGDLGVRASIKLSYCSLDASTRRAFRALGLLPVPEFDAWALAPLLDVRPATAERLAESLVDVHLLDVEGFAPGGRLRYRVHDLVRAFARERADDEDPAVERTAALDRVFSAFHDLAARAAARLPGSTPWPTLLSPPTTWQPPATLVNTLLAEPAGWLRIEEQTLVAIVESAARANRDDVATGLAAGLLSSFAGRNQFTAWARTHEAALAASRRVGDRYGEAVLLAGLGQLSYEQDRFDEAEQRHREALTLFGALGDDYGDAAVRAALGTVLYETARFAESRELLRASRQTFCALGDMRGRALADHGLGVVHREQGRFGPAIRHFEAALATHRELGDDRSAAFAVRAIGLVHRATGDLEEAERCFEESLATFRRLGDPLGRVYATQALAKARIRLGCGAGEEAGLRRTLDECTQLGDRFGQALVTRTLGELCLATGRPEEAQLLLCEALTCWRQLDLPLWQARTMRDLAWVNDALGAPANSDRLLRRAGLMFRKLGAREGREELAPWFREDCVAG